MKKILVLILALSLTLGLILPLASCKKDDGIPEGMQLVRGGEDLGYYFYAPEEWKVANDGEIASVYSSVSNTASVTFTPAALPDDADLDTAESTNRNEIGTNIDEYFERERKSFPFDIEVKTACQPVNFGNAESAYKYVYTYKYGKDETTALDMSCMQIFVKHGERFYIFTYTANNYKYDNEYTYYQFYLEEKIPAIIDNFKFTAISGEGGGSIPSYERDADGYILISDERLAKVKLYVPEDFRVITSEATVTATRGEVSVNLSAINEVSNSNEGALSYWKARKSELEFISGNTLTIATDDNGAELVNVPVEIDGARWAFSYEYTYTLAGETYSVYQVYASTLLNAFTYTYTVRADSISTEQMAEALKILEKLEA